MINMGLGLSFSVLTLYTLYRFFSIKNALTQQLTFTNFLSFIFYGLYNTATMNYASKLTTEVRIVDFNEILFN